MRNWSPEMCGPETLHAKLDRTPQTESEGKSPKMQVAALRKLWTELSMHENQARIRNRQLLQDFAEVEAQLADLSAKIDALRMTNRMRSHLVKSNSEESFQHPRRQLQKPQGSDVRQELLARPHSANWNRQLPFEIRRQRKQLPFHPLEMMPSRVPETYGRLWSGFEEHRKICSHSVAHPFPSITLSSQTSRKHCSQAWSSSQFPWRPQKDEEALISPSQDGSFSLPSHPWTIPREATMLRRDLSQEWRRTSLVQVPENHPTESPSASTPITREVLREEDSSSGCSGEELNSMSIRWKGCSLVHSPEGRSQAAMFFRDTTAAWGRRGPLVMSLGGSGLDTDEADLEQDKPESSSKALLRPQGMQLKRCEDAPTTVLSEDLSQVPLNRFPELLQEDETAIIQEASKFLGQEEILDRDGQEDEHLGGKEEWEKERESGSEAGKGAGNLDLGWDKRSGDHASPRETPSDNAEEGAVVLEPGQGEQEDGNHIEDERRTGEGNNTPGPLVGSQNGQEFREATAGLEAPVVAEKLDMGDGNSQERSQSEDEEKGGTSRNYGKPDRAGGSGAEQGGTESQEGVRSPEDDAASINTGSQQFPLESRICDTSELDDSGSCETSSLQNGQPLRVKLMEEGTESICEGEEEEEVEESEADTDIEAALAPFSKKLKARDQQSETDLQRLQDLWADAEEGSKDDSLQYKDDFYD